MPLEDASATSRVSREYAVTLPDAVRARLDVEPGDRVRWVAEDGELTVRVVRERYGAMDDFEPVDAGEETNAVEMEAGFGAE